MVAAPVPGAREMPPSDSSTCSAWDTTEADLNSTCTHAAYLGEVDDISLVAAMNHAF